MAIASHADSPELTSKEKAVLRYADAMTSTPVDVPDELFGELKGFLDDAQIMELTSSIAWENYRARFNHALLMESEGFSEGSRCPLPLGPGASG